MREQAPVSIVVFRSDTHEGEEAGPWDFQMAADTPLADLGHALTRVGYIPHLTAPEAVWTLYAVPVGDPFGNRRKAIAVISQNRLEPYWIVDSGNRIADEASLWGSPVMFRLYASYEGGDSPDKVLERLAGEALRA